MNAYVVSADRRLLEALRQTGEYGAVLPVSKEMISVLLAELEGRQEQPGRRNAAGLSADIGIEAYTDDISIMVPAPVDSAMSASDVWIVSDGLLDIYEAVALRSLYPAGKFVYLLSNDGDAHAMRAMQSLCAAHEMDYVPPYRTTEQVADEISAICFTRNQSASKVIALVGALPQLGLTSSLLRTGIALAKLAGIRVGILGLNGWNPGDSGLAYTGKYLDELWGNLQGKQLQAGELKEKMLELAPGVHYLAGNRDLKKLYYYHTEGIAWLIDKARECFDIVLLDAGSYPDHALSAQSIHTADLILVQMGQSRQAKEQWRRMCEHILQPIFHMEQRQPMLLFNKMIHSPEMENEKQLSRQLNMPYVGSLPYIDAFGRSESDRSLLSQAWPEYDKELNKVCKAILQYYDLPVVSPAKESASVHAMKPAKSGWLRWMKPVREA
ncbi:hypothetical protein N0M98_15060 [Paenibacillus doosanensis]|uniref:hypothetical protein n=1 Tax=Paenibacillus doosanensis TaxID=1229154 RepID=UPI00217F6F46|nr:hypothetical protein [Paenibacillus doosanensis]MCS7461470.1 hypothetical protein [Paenibacillus doosanensis]